MTGRADGRKHEEWNGPGSHTRAERRSANSFQPKKCTGTADQTSQHRRCQINHELWFALEHELHRELDDALAVLGIGEAEIPIRLAISN
jgi:hypothetical protein